MVSMMPSIRERADEAMAVPALEHLLGGLRITRSTANFSIARKLILKIVVLCVNTCLFIQTQKFLAWLMHRFTLFFCLCRWRKERKVGRPVGQQKAARWRERTRSRSDAG